MEAIDSVLAQYIPTSTELTGGLSQRRKASVGNDIGADYQIRIELPDLIRDGISKIGRDVSAFRVYGSVGQTNFPIARVPWVSALRREITISTRRGYYIVLLFREDMAGCALSLNQGFTQYRERFGTDALAEQKAKEGAALAATYLDVPAGFVRGVIDLAATGDLGKGYEQGAIVSKIYSGGEPSPETFFADLQTLLNLYDVLYQRLGTNIVDKIPPPEEQEFQKAATALSAVSSGKKNYKAPPPGPVAPPQLVMHSSGASYVRDPAVAAEAISKASYQCELDAMHMSFVSRITNRNFVEAHHLIPIQFQGEFVASLDVVENVTVLCPTCHRLLHHGRTKDRDRKLAPLYTNRIEALKSRGLTLSFSQLCSFYRKDIEVD